MVLEFGMKIHFLVVQKSDYRFIDIGIFPLHAHSQDLIAGAVVCYRCTVGIAKYVMDKVSKTLKSQRIVLF